jgi:hypothetical protein
MKQRVKAVSNPLHREIEKGKGADQDFELKPKPGIDPADLRIVVFVQQVAPGKVLGAASRKMEN